MKHQLKDLIKGNVYFVEYRKGNLWYEAGRHSTNQPFLFPVPIEDTGDGIFKDVDRGIFFMRYIRQHLQLSNWEVQVPSLQVGICQFESDLSYQNNVLRSMLAHRVAGYHLYTDDGELQDNSSLPYIDLKRDPVDLIAEKLLECYYKILSLIK